MPRPGQGSLGTGEADWPAGGSRASSGSLRPEHRWLGGSTHRGARVEAVHTQVVTILFILKYTDN